MSSSYRMELDRWLSQLNVKVEVVLDIGGSQEPVKGRTKSWQVENYYIGDLEEPHKDSPKPDFIINLNGFVETDLKGDMVFCLEVFDYVYDPVNAFQVLANLTKRGGTIWATFPFIYPQHQPIDDDALRYTIGSIFKLAEVAGLTVAHYQLRRPETNLTKFFSDERMRAAKNVDHQVTGWIVKLIK